MGEDSTVGQLGSLIGEVSKIPCLSWGNMTVGHDPRAGGWLGSRLQTLVGVATGECTSALLGGP